jgi:hypothetical protein
LANFVTQVAATGICGATASDSLVITTPSSPASTIPAICGTNTNQHSKTFVLTNTKKRQNDALVVITIDAA